MIPLVLVFAILAPGVVAATASAAGAAPVAHVAAFDKTKFVLEVGGAAFLIHRYIYTPWKANGLKGFSGKLAKIKAVLAAGAAVLLLKKAYTIANSGNSALLKKIVSPLNALIALLGKIKGGDTSSVPTANTTLSSLSSLSGSAGVPFTDVTTGL